MRHVEYAKVRINVQIFNRRKQFTVFLRQGSIKKAADVPSKTKTQANSLVRLGYDVVGSTGLEPVTPCL